MDIRFTSTLTSEDENIVAPAILTALASILDLLPIAYMIRIDTVDSHVYQHTGPATRLHRWGIATVHILALSRPANRNRTLHLRPAPALSSPAVASS
ncbi:MAG TPA: hypothetical protein VF424_15910, partial [Vicinamibacterales bacterium]